MSFKIKKGNLTFSKKIIPKKKCVQSIKFKGAKKL